MKWRCLSVTSTDTNAFRDNEVAVFNIAWRNCQDIHLATYKMKGRTGSSTQYLPMPLRRRDVTAAEALAAMAASRHRQPKPGAGLILPPSAVKLFRPNPSAVKRSGNRRKVAEKRSV
jgi:hypothetical protein